MLSFGPNLWFRLWVWTWTKLNNIGTILGLFISCTGKPSHEKECSGVLFHRRGIQKFKSNTIQMFCIIWGECKLKFTTGVWEDWGRHLPDKDGRFFNTGSLKSVHDEVKF